MKDTTLCLQHPLDRLKVLCKGDYCNQYLTTTDILQQGQYDELIGTTLVMKVYDYKDLEKFFNATEETPDIAEYYPVIDKYIDDILDKYYFMEIQVCEKLARYNQHCTSGGKLLKYPELISYGILQVINDKGDRSATGKYAIFPYIKHSPLFFTDTSVLEVFGQISRLAKLGVYNYGISASNIVIDEMQKCFMLDYSHCQMFDETDKSLIERYELDMINAFKVAVREYREKHDLEHR